ncbi:hypothetical protein PLICRDRAFT_180587 [Plicaturopsis crispa FD-325 SS-3]|uniref:N-acetyltransferase domain-containing protein n=1 Tax=Plicaturopsis crispa FD-325 SS-3 TaxID=944288 RepID=A0A0C9SK63_PLICR|nr:hypothetical protein PLICRDRAFT_180587 [Plicaturopsis crispa FD-325 SS-3]
MAAPNIPADMHRSERLVYRAWEDADVEHVIRVDVGPGDAHKVVFARALVRFYHFTTLPLCSFLHSFVRGAGLTGNETYSPRSKKELAEHWAERAPAALLCAVICLPSASDPLPTGTRTGITGSPTGIAGPPIAIAGTPIGVIDFSPPLAHNRTTTMSVLISPSHQRLGYGTEAVGWILEQALMRLGMHLSASPLNVGARRAYEKAGILEEDWFALQERKKAAAAAGASQEVAAGASASQA